MKKTLQLVWLLLLAAVGFAQNLTTVTATKIQKAGVLLPSGKIYFQATDSSDNPISFQVGGGGQAVNYPYCGVVVSGTITSACTGGTFQVANPGTTAPLNLNYRVTVTDGTRTLLTYPGVQFTGATFNFDNYVPSSNLPLGVNVPFLTVGTEFLTNYADVTEIPNPGNPATGLERWYANNSTHQLSCLTSSGSNCAPGGGSGAFNGGLGTSFQDAALITQPANPTAGNARLYVDSGTNKLSCLLPTGASCNPTSSPGGGNTLVQYNNNGQFGAIAEAHLGAVLIDQGPGQPPAFADPLVQGLNAEGSTATNNPVNVGGFDTAGTPAIHGVKVLNSAPGGTEYGFVVRVAGTPAVSISGTPSVSISGTPTVTANLGTLNGVALDASVTGLEVAQGSTSSGQKGILHLGAVTTATPTYTTGQSSALSLDTSGNLRTIATISGTPAVTISGTPSVSISGTPTVTANLGTLNGAALDASVTGLEVAQGSTTSGQKGILGLAAVTTSAPTYTTAQSAPLSVDTSGNLRTLATISGTPSVTIQSNASVNINQIAGSTASTAATGVLKVGVVGNAGIALDGAQGSTAPANGLVTGGVFNTAAPSLTNGQMSQVQMDANGNIKVAIAAGGGSGGTASTFGAAFPGTGTAIGFQPDGGGNMKAGLVDASGFMEVNCKAGCTSASDNTAGSTAISNGTTNSTITLTMAGENRATFQLQSGGTLIATVTPQCSFDGGTTFPVNGIIQDPVTGQISLTATIASAQATTDYPVVCPQGASTIQLKATSYTSGTANFLARSTINNGPSLLMGLVTSSAPTYSNNTFNGLSIDTSGNVRTAVTNTVTVSGTVSTTPPANASTNLTQINGTAANTAAAGTILVGLADGAGNKLTTNSSTFTAKFALDENLLGTLGTAFTTPGFVDIKGADGNVFVRQATGTNLHMVCDSGCSSSAGFADSAAFTTGTTAINPVGGLFDDTPPTAITTGHAAAARITPNRAIHINLRNQAGTEIGTSSNPVRVDPTGTTTQPISAASLPLPTGAAQDSSLTTLDTDVKSNVTLHTGTNLIGKAGFDGTTPGSTNGVTQFQPSRTTGTITSAASTVSVGTTGYGVATVTTNGTYAGVTINFEFSDDSGTTWYSETCTRTDTNVQENFEVLPSNQTRAWDCAVYAATNFRVRASAWTSGTANIGLTLSAAPIEPAQTVGVSGTVPISGTVNQGTANTAANAWPVIPGDGASNMGTQANFGTSPGAVKSLNVNASLFVGTAAPSASNPLPARECDGTNCVTIDPCRINANSFAKINQTASAQVITGTAAKKTYICSINLVTAGANNVAIVEGTGTTCATGIAGVSTGGTTAATGWNFAANGGLTEGSGLGSVMAANNANADNVCILQSAAVQLSGVIGYVQQ